MAQLQTMPQHSESRTVQPPSPGKAAGGSHSRSYAFNQTRQAFLAHDVSVADNHWRRLVGLLRTEEESFVFGKGLWIVPCRGVHTLAMRYAIDVVYLNQHSVVVHLEENIRPWRLAPLRRDTASVLELPAHTIWSTETQVGDLVVISRISR